MNRNNVSLIKQKFQQSFFDEFWYQWQNPDCKKYEGSAIEHYWDIGIKENRDPSPRIDMTKLIRMTGSEAGHDVIFELIVNKKLGRAFGVYQTWDDLILSQSEFQATLDTYCHKYIESPRNRYLVYVQAGNKSIHRSWYDRSKACFDLAINRFDGATPLDADSDYNFSQNGTKFTAISRLNKQYREFFEGYEYVFFLDDDIYIETEAVNKLFEICDSHGLDAAQPSLSKDSHCIWDVFYNNGNVTREVNSVEIMMPVLSKRLLGVFGGEFSRSISGFGLDMLMGKRITEIGGKAGVVDQVCAKHRKPIDDKGGAYYEFMRSNMINPKSELWYLAKEFDLETGFFETGAFEKAQSKITPLDRAVM